MSAAVRRNQTAWRLLVGTSPAGARVLVGRTGRAVPAIGRPMGALAAQEGAA
ncbi:hypothetical protein [Umezawaea sp. Da 62-37]|uniref:hypothetical protein n=1 Tax=Umezawaea sp. Da 62-37 TaxID=3075927 RepID=UPI0028F72508|nr:hypothetical protein [Umezawaea sp. Da 62-37]WNV91535.1 hypothetical protein RM788_25735 [Umezawaea sp. Da 62-37]